jgi:hypothetical protein
VVAELLRWVALFAAQDILAVLQLVDGVLAVAHLVLDNGCLAELSMGARVI